MPLSNDPEPAVGRDWWLVIAPSELLLEALRLVGVTLPVYVFEQSQSLVAASFVAVICGLAGIVRGTSCHGARAVRATETGIEVCALLSGDWTAISWGRIEGVRLWRRWFTWHVAVLAEGQRGNQVICCWEQSNGVAPRLFVRAYREACRGVDSSWSRFLRARFPSGRLVLRVVFEVGLGTLVARRWIGPELPLQLPFVYPMVALALELISFAVAISSNDD